MEQEKNGKKNVWQFVKFALFSASAGLIQIGSFTLLNEVVMKTDWLQGLMADHAGFAKIMQNEYGPCYLIALILSVIWNFTINRKFTFKSANNVPIAMLKVAAYYVVFTPASTGLDKLLTDKAGWNPFLVTALLMILNFVTEFLYQRFYVFKDSIDSAVKEKDEDTPEKTE